MAHFHSCLEFVWVHSGVLYATLDAHHYTVIAGQLLIVTGNTLHTYQKRGENNVTVITVPLYAIPSIQNKLRENTFRSLIYDVSANTRLLTILTLIDEGFDIYNEETVSGLCQAFIGMLITDIGLIPIRNDSQRGTMRSVLVYLQDNFQYGITPASLALHFGYSKSRFSHLFNETFGCSIGTIINRLRCQKAAQGLLERDRTVLDVALNVGFNCARTFYRAFKQCYGITPTEYVEMNTKHYK